MLHCKSLLDIYHQKNNPTASSVSSNQVNCNANKTYPLAFNAYNLDEETPPLSTSEIRVTTSACSTEVSMTTITANTNETSNAELSQEEAQKEKEKIVEKLFG